MVRYSIFKIKVIVMKHCWYNNNESAKGDYRRENG
jgi:hypothetical protein